MPPKRFSRKELAKRKLDQSKSDNGTRKKTTSSKQKPAQKNKPTTTENRKTKPAAVTPDKRKNPKSGKPGPKQNKETQYWLFTLIDDSVKIKRNLEDANTFRREYPEMIRLSIEFTRKKDLDDYLANVKLNPGQKHSSNPHVSYEDQAKILRIQEKMEQAKPSNDFNFYYKTTSMSKACVIIMRPLNIQREDFWLWKAYSMTECLKWYFNENKTNNELLNQFFANLITVKQRDPNKSPDKPKVSFSKDTTKTYTNYHAASHIILPMDSIDSEESEKAVIETFLDSLHNTMRSLVSTPNQVFDSVLQNQMSPKMWETCTQPKYGLSIKGFILRSKTVPIRLEDLTVVVTTDESRKLKSTLMKYETSDRKYTNGQQKPQNHKTENHSNCESDSNSDSDSESLTDPHENDNSKESDNDSDTDDNQPIIRSKRAALAINTQTPPTPTS